MELNERLEAFAELGNKLKSIPDEVLIKAYQQNNWFTKENVVNAAKVWSETLTRENLEKWIKPYHLKIHSPAKRVGVVNAGNIPFVGLHDFIFVLISGNQYMGK